MDPWNTRFSFYWYNDFEILHATQDDLNRKAQDLAREGVNLVITFSSTHFRWSFLPWHDLLLKTLVNVVKACHDHDIRVVEHHSATLTFNPLCPEDEQYVVDVLRLRHSQLDAWPGLREFIHSDPEIDGVPMSAMQQVDGRTGELTRSIYRGYVMCPNNADYLQAYLKRLEDVYATGIDGIMTDDVQLLGETHSCACPVCRTQFAEQTGYDMPSPGEAWEAWHGNYDDPSYPAWLDFRLRSVERYHESIYTHYQGLGLNLLRPNYCSGVLNANPSAYSLETLPALDWVSAELCLSDIMQYAWPDWCTELAQRFAVGRHRGIPAGGYFYPSRPDTVTFAWALSKICGVLYQPVREGGDISEDACKTEEHLDAFENAHVEAYHRPTKFATLGFYDSRRTREIYQYAETRSLASQNGWMHACLRGNMPFDMFSQDELPSRLEAYTTVMLSEAACLSDEELSAFKVFAEAGGTLLWAGKTGQKDSTGQNRPEGALAVFLGLDDFRFAEKGDAPVRYAVGEGALITLPIDIGMDVRAKGFFSSRVTLEEPGTDFSYDTPKLRRRCSEMLALLRERGHRPCMTVENAPADLLVSAFNPASSDMLAVHVLNATDTQNVSLGARVTHEDPIHFPALRQENPIHVTLRKPADLNEMSFASATYYDPQTDTPFELSLVDHGETVELLIPSECIQAYGLIEFRSTS